MFEDNEQQIHYDTFLALLKDQLSESGCHSDLEFWRFQFINHSKWIAQHWCRSVIIYSRSSCLLVIQIVAPDRSMFQTASGFALTMPGQTITSVNYDVPLSYFVTMSSCTPSTVIVGPFKHQSFTMSVTINFNELQTTMSFQADQITDLVLTPANAMTSVVSNIVVGFTLTSTVNALSFLEIKFDFRDFLNSNPSEYPILTYSPNCQALSGVGSSLSCIRINNKINVYNLGSSVTGPISFSISQVQMPQSTQPYTVALNVYTQLSGTQFITQQITGVKLTAQNPNQNLFVQIIQTNQLISQTNTLTASLTIYDFLYPNTNIIINIPTGFTASSMTFKPVFNIVNNPSISILGNQIVISSCISNFLQANSFIIFNLEYQNPNIPGEYPGFNVQLTDSNGFKISNSVSQSMVLLSTIIQVNSIQLSSYVVSQQSTYQFDLIINSDVQTTFYMTLQFLIPVSFTTLQLISSNNVNTNTKISINNGLITFTDIFIGQPLTQGTARSMTIAGITNPRSIQSVSIQYQFQMFSADKAYIYNQLPNVPIIKYSPSQIDISSITQSSLTTCNTTNTITVSLNFAKSLITNDIILIEYNTTAIMMMGQNQTILCSINSNPSTCAVIGNIIQLTTGSSLTATQIQVKGLISNRGINQTNQIQITHYDQSLNKIDTSILSQVISVPNAQEFVLQYTIDSKIIGQISNLNIQLQARINLYAQERFIITLHPALNTTQLVCLVNSITVCSQQANILTLILSQDLQAGLTSQVQLINLTNPSQSMSISPFTIQAQTSDQFTILQSNATQTSFSSNTQLFRYFSLIQVNNRIQQVTTYNLTFQSSFPIVAKNQLKLLVDPAINISNANITTNISYTIYPIENSLIMQCDNLTGSDVQVILIQNIVNPQSKISDLMSYLYLADNTTIIETGQYRLSPFFCLDNCSLCNGTTCTTCNFQVPILYNNQCLEKCPNLTVQINSTCVLCKTDATCTLCSSSNVSQCSQCISGYELRNGTCQIPIIQTIVPILPMHQKSMNFFGECWFLYLMILVFTLCIIRKVQRKSTNFYKSYSLFMSLIEPIAQITALALFLVQQQDNFSVFQIAVMMLKLFILINASMDTIHIFDSDSIYQVCQRQSTFKIMHKLILYYDSQLFNVFKCHFADHQILAINFKSNLILNRINYEIINQQIRYYNPLCIAISIVYIILNTHEVFIIEYLCFFAMKEFIQIMINKQLNDEFYAQKNTIQGRQVQQ